MGAQLRVFWEERSTDIQILELDLVSTGVTGRIEQFIRIRLARYSHNTPNYRAAKQGRGRVGSLPVVTRVFGTDLPQYTGTGCVSAPRLSTRAARRG